MKVTTDGCLFGAWVAEKVGTQESEVRTALDIGTGTGLLSLMLAQKNPNLLTDAIEIDKEAAEQAIENVASSSWKERTKVHHSDANKFQSDSLYDLIISNPPFYENELKSEKSQKNIAHHSDKLSLKELLTIIKNSISSDGIFCLLLPYKRNAEAKIMLNEAGLNITQLTFVRQSTSHDFFRIMILGKIATEATEEPIETMIDEISIKNDSGQYTPAFTNLLKEYYLHL
jgi:tRNA1Val (adenine37-N6)-methyltransferase